MLTAKTQRAQSDFFPVKEFLCVLCVSAVKTVFMDEHYLHMAQASLSTGSRSHLLPAGPSLPRIPALRDVPASLQAKKGRITAAS